MRDAYRTIWEKDSFTELGHFANLPRADNGYLDYPIGAKEVSFATENIKMSGSLDLMALR